MGTITGVEWLSYIVDVISDIWRISILPSAMAVLAYILVNNVLGWLCLHTLICNCYFLIFMVAILTRMKGNLCWPFVFHLLKIICSSFAWLLAFTLLSLYHRGYLSSELIVWRFNLTLLLSGCLWNKWILKIKITNGFWVYNSSLCDFGYFTPPSHSFLT